jgi:hypothetical protein
MGIEKMMQGITDLEQQKSNGFDSRRRGGNFWWEKTDRLKDF